MIAGEVDVAIVPIGTIGPNIESRQLRALGIDSAKRSPALPDVPTVAEDGIPGLEVCGWQGWFVPANTPAERGHAIYREIAKTIAELDVQRRLGAMRNEAVASTPEEFAAGLGMISRSLLRSSTKRVFRSSKSKARSP